MKFLAVSQNSGDPTPVLVAEAERMAALVAAGVVEHVYLKTDYSGAVLILETPDEQQATAELDTLPTVLGGLTTFTVTPIMVAPGSSNG